MYHFCDQTLCKQIANKHVMFNIFQVQVNNRLASHYDCSTLPGLQPGPSATKMNHDTSLSIPMSVSTCQCLNVHTAWNWFNQTDQQKWWLHHRVLYPCFVKPFKKPALWWFIYKYMHPWGLYTWGTNVKPGDIDVFTGIPYGISKIHLKLLIKGAIMWYDTG